MESQPSSPLASHSLDHIFIQGHVSIPLSPSEQNSCTLYRQDYESMLPRRWLRTEAINAVLKMLVEGCLGQIAKIYASRGIIAEEEHREYVKIVDAFVVTLIMTTQDQAILQSLAPLSLLSARVKCLLLPVNTENGKGSHWVLGCLLNGRFQGGEEKSHLVIFDSGYGGVAMGPLLRGKLMNLYKILEGVDMDIEVVSASNILYQDNSYDCGVFTIGFGEYVLKELVSQLDEGGPLRLDRFNSHFKYLLGNSGMARSRYRGMLEEQLRRLT